MDKMDRAKNNRYKRTKRSRGSTARRTPQTEGRDTYEKVIQTGQTMHKQDK